MLKPWDDGIGGDGGDGGPADPPLPSPPHPQSRNRTESRKILTKFFIKVFSWLVFGAFLSRWQSGEERVTRPETNLRAVGTAKRMSKRRLTKAGAIASHNVRGLIRLQR